FRPAGRAPHRAVEPGSIRSADGAPLPRRKGGRLRNRARNGSTVHGTSRRRADHGLAARAPRSFGHCARLDPGPGLARRGPVGLSIDESEVSWKVIEAGAPVATTDGEKAGTVSRVVGDTDADVFTGLAIKVGI